VETAVATGFVDFVADIAVLVAFVDAFAGMLEAVLTENMGREVVAADWGRAGGETVTTVWLVAAPMTTCINNAKLRINAWKRLGKELKNSITKVYLYFII
jgi:hypothetical protein